ncbi:hypothetical protein BO82DRAFT_421458, partial [Aspergillus uvarum CBS 121591]
SFVSRLQRATIEVKTAEGHGTGPSSPFRDPNHTRSRRIRIAILPACIQIQLLRLGEHIQHQLQLPTRTILDVEVAPDLPAPAAEARHEPQREQPPDQLLHLVRMHDHRHDGGVRPRRERPEDVLCADDEIVPVPALFEAAEEVVVPAVVLGYVGGGGRAAVHWAWWVAGCGVLLGLWLECVGGCGEGWTPFLIHR